MNDSTSADTTVILSKDLRVQGQFSDMQVTIAELETHAPAVSLYRFVNAEETAYMELNGSEMTRLLEAYTAKHATSLPRQVDIAPALHAAKNKLDRLSDRGLNNDAGVGGVLEALIRDLAALTLPQEQQEQIEHFLDHFVSYVVPQFTQQEK